MASLASEYSLRGIHTDQRAYSRTVTGESAILGGQLVGHLRRTVTTIPYLQPLLGVAA